MHRCGSKYADTIANKEGPDQTPLIWVFTVCHSSQCLILVCTVCQDLIILIVKRESLFSCFIIKAGSMDKSKNLSICSDCKKNMKQFFFEFHIVQGVGQYSETFNLPLANSTRDRQVGNCLFLTLKTFLVSNFLTYWSKYLLTTSC